MRTGFVLTVALLLGQLPLVWADPPAQQSLWPKKLSQQQCSLAGQLDTLRAGLVRGSPALKKLLRRHLRELAPAIPESELRTALQHETDPAMVEELSGALAARMARLGEPGALRAPLQRAVSDPDPEARAAALRGLRGTATVEAMGKLGQVDYTKLVRDPSPVVRQAVLQNLLSENSQIYFGHDAAVSEKAIAVALAARSGPSADPALAARLLSEISTESVGHGAVEELLSLLDGPLDAGQAGLRAAAVTALGGVPGAEAAAVISRLTEQYRKDPAAEVRVAILESLVRLTMSGAPPLLESLRAVDTSLDAEIDAWLRALRSGLQEWSLLRREKQGVKSSSTGTPRPAMP